jgi:diguanylate cyclase (GGDEF)-like protein
MARATLTFAENVSMLRLSRGEALTDPLTGLGNRRALQRTLAELIPAASAEHPLVLAIFDLDGFKAYNDAFGHPAGDTLLIRLGANLEAFLHGRGRAFRMGGDVFCALFEAPAGVREAIVLGAAEALSDQGDGFAIDCSHGAVTLPVECDSAPEALRIADQRMYANKHAGRLAAGRRGGIVGETAALAAASATALGLDPDAAEDVRHAAELHDIGKVALPDAILGKPGPLSETEWEFVRRHPVIGERMILATPALRRSAKLVRASHERWDGNGYPDALAGEAVPLGARIVAVADAYAAMTAERPWRAALTPEAAIAELRSGAGTQFDPAVVDAWCAAWALRTLASAAAA